MSAGQWQGSYFANICRSARDGKRWVASMLGILYVVDGDVQFCDDWDHWRNGFCRLLEIEEEKGKLFVENAIEAALENFGAKLSSLATGPVLACLKEAVTRTLYGGSRPLPGEVTPAMGVDLTGSPADTIFAGSISGNQARLVVGNRDHEFGWLVDRSSGRPVSADTIIYDRTYFSEGRAPHYGIKGYLAHRDWRLEKARRLVRTVMQNLDQRVVDWRRDPASVCVLDVGSAVGYFRRAFSEWGFSHYGTELSREMIELCRETFGFDTWWGGISALGSVACGKKFQIISLWDVIEHLADVVKAIESLKSFLAEDGVIVVRTPNLMALETDILGDFHYSFKLDHLLYFSPRSLDDMMKRLGLSRLYLETDSQIFKGFLPADTLFKTGRALKGADILAIYAINS